MSLFRVKYLSFFFILISVFSFFNIIYSYYFNLYLNLNTYYISLSSSLIIGLIFYKLKEINKKPTIFESAHPVTGEPGILCHLEDDAREHGDGYVEHAGGEAHGALELSLVRRVHAAPVPLHDRLGQLPAENNDLFW